LQSEHGRLKAVEPPGPPDAVVTILLPLAVLAEHPDGAGNRSVVRDDGAGVSHRAQVLRRVEAERRAYRAQARCVAGTHGAVCLARVLDEAEVVSLGDLAEARHVGKLPVQVNWEKPLDARADRGLHRGRVHGVVGG
jgi:hypothetical protein